MSNPSIDSTRPLPVTFTVEEEKILTPLDAAAHDLLRTEAIRKNELAPCWLVCSDDVRKEYRQKVSTLVAGSIGFLAATVDIASVISRSIPKHLVEAWRAAELDAKIGRSENNPRAFFTS